MASYFFDSCAIAKRYVRERGTTYMQQLCAVAATGNDDLYISQLALVEVIRVISAKARKQQYRHRRRRFAARDGLIAQFEAHCDPSGGDYDVLEMMPEVVARAGNLCKTSSIKSLDAVQLASALIVRDFALTGGDPAPVFVTADGDLLAYAQAQGFTVWNPEHFTDPSEANLPSRASTSGSPDILPTWRDFRFPAACWIARTVCSLSLSLRVRLAYR